MTKTAKKRRTRDPFSKSSFQKSPEKAWQIQTAKAQFSEIFHLARTAGPQRITLRGKEGVVMISDEQYEQLVGRSHQRKNLVEFFRESPLVGIELKLERPKGGVRDIDL
ncbi:MAG TPA: type II toxin-antitoxin system prevent-host-death family antitoxin [Terriglobales bacterium]|nr:type II toxin-antitoxin system prevent-host-death family antitoxin [Terriglobales bacterium]